MRRFFDARGRRSGGALLALGACALLAAFVPAAHATTIEWHARFPGFRPGDVWFAGAVVHSTGYLDRDPSLFVYSPSEDRISEIVSLSPTVDTTNIRLAFDPTRSILYVADVGKIEAMTPDGVLVPFAPTFTTLLDLTVAEDGAVYTVESHHLRRYADGEGTTVAVFDRTMRGIAAVQGGFVVTVEAKPSESTHLAWLSPLGEVQRWASVGRPRLSPGLVRAMPDGESVVALVPRTVLHFVSASGSARTFADDDDGIHQTEGLAIDAARGGTAWVSTGTGSGELLAFTTDGARVARVPLQLKQLGYPRDKGFILATGVACAPGTTAP